ncbi:MAG TPA: phosphatase PAP2 family protein [Mycobacteriales bacterium]|nr:phosphatase PAP2 family protein [Mycobacteriales bacterium]
MDLRQHHHEPLPVLRRRLLIAGVVLFVLGVALSVVVASSAVLQPLDDRFLRLMVSLRTTPAVDVGKVLNVAFGTAVLLPLRIVITVVLAVRRHWAALGAWLATLATSELLIGPLKALVDRPRPPGPLIATSGASYPSGHAIASAVTAIGVVMALTSGRRRLHWMVAAVCLAALVALSRTYLSAHWLTDVVGGSLLGAGLALGIPEGVEVWRDRRLSRRRPGPPPTAAS